MVKTKLTRYDWLFIMGLQETTSIVDPPFTIVTMLDVKLRTFVCLKNGVVHKALDKVNE